MKTNNNKERILDILLLICVTSVMLCFAIIFTSNNVSSDLVMLLFISFGLSVVFGKLGYNEKVKRANEDAKRLNDKYKL